MRQFSLKRFISSSVLLLALIALIGCSSDSDNGSASTDGEWAGETVKVMIIGDYKMESSTDPITGEKVEGLQPVKDEFEERYPGATLEFVLTPWKGYTEKTQAMITSGAADVFQMPGIVDFASQGLLEPLEPYIEEDDFDLDAYLNGQVDGWLSLGPDDEELQIYGLPQQGGARYFAYDKKLFEQWGVEPLSKNPTMEEILEKAEKMTGTNPETGEENYGAWFRGDWQTAFTVVNTAEAQNSEWGTGYSWDEMELNFDSPEMVKGLKWLTELKEFTPRGILSNQGDEKWMTENNNIAIMLDQNNDIIIKPAEAAGLTDRIEIVNTFSNDEGKGGYFAGSPLSIAQSSDNKDLAWEYIKFTSSDFFQEFNWDEHGQLPVIKSALEWESITENKLAFDSMEALDTAWTPRYPWAASQPRFILGSNIENALTGKMPAEEALEKSQKESQDWLDNK